MHGHEELSNCYDDDKDEEKVHLLREKPNTGDGANLESNHSHFLLVDDHDPTTHPDLDGGDLWQTEIPFRFALEETYCRLRAVPRVLLVVQGGPGSLACVKRAVQSSCPCVLVIEQGAGGLAVVLKHFIETYRDHRNHHHRHGEILPEFATTYALSRPDLEMIAELDWQLFSDTGHQLITWCHVGVDELDAKVLEALLEAASRGIHRMPDMESRGPPGAEPESSQQRHTDRQLLMAVEWNRPDIVRRLLDSGPIHRKTKKTALQRAVEHQFPELVRLLSSVCSDALDFIAIYSRPVSTLEELTRSNPTFRKALEHEVLKDIKATDAKATDITRYQVP